MPETRQLVTFYLNDLLFGVPARDVQEIIRGQSMTRVPLAHAAVLGLINLRGQIVTVIDLKERLSVKRVDPSKARRQPGMVVVRSGNGLISFQVDGIGDVLDVDDTTFEPMPQNAEGAGRDLVAGVHKLEGRLLHVLAAERVMDFRSKTAPPPAITVGRAS